ncbi:MAG: PIN domain-containing protein [Roseimicrobium sp.]
MTVVLDTNVLVPALNARHRFSCIVDAWVVGRYLLTVSTDIIFEYEEVVTCMLGRGRWLKFGRLMDVVAATKGNLVRVANYFQFHTIPIDRDDDKFAGCAIHAHAKHVVTEDRHFRTLAGTGYKPQPIKADEFIRRYLSP